MTFFYQDVDESPESLGARVARGAAWRRIIIAWARRQTPPAAAFPSAFARYKVKSFVQRKNFCAANEGSLRRKALCQWVSGAPLAKSCQANSRCAEFSVSAMTF
jgi:hypothetical protein